MKQVGTLKVNTGHTARILFNEEYEEFTVKFYDEEKQHLTGADYFTDNLEDARGTARAELERMKEAAQ